MIVVDSSVWIDFFNDCGRGLSATPASDQLDALLGQTPVAIGDLILVEMLQGFRSDAEVATARELFRSVPVVEMLGSSNAYKAAENYWALRKKGIRIRKTVDVIIATACIEAHLPLLFSDRDFQPFVEHLGLEAA